jgi:hypothetical protein
MVTGVQPAQTSREHQSLSLHGPGPLRGR